MSADLPRVVIRRPKVSEGGVRRTQGSTVRINNYCVPCVHSVELKGEPDSLWQVTITLNAADVIFEDEE